MIIPEGMENEANVGTEGRGRINTKRKTEDNTINYSYLIRKLAAVERDSNSLPLTPIERIDELRKEIDECDRALVQIFQRRMELVQEILECKRSNSLPILHSQREEEIVSKALAGLKEAHFSGEVEQFLREILKLSRKLQSKRLFPYNIVLIGFMGTGKSTVGRDLAQKLEMSYVDTDAMIQEKTGMAISEIFEKHGEPYFRDIESQVVEVVSGLKNTIILCGGGVVLNTKNVENLRKNGKLVLLKAKPETIMERLYEDETRPVLKGYFSLEGLQQLMKTRNDHYNSAAHIVVETDEKSVDAISSQIISNLYLMENSGE